LVPRRFSLCREVWGRRPASIRLKKGLVVVAQVPGQGVGLNLVPIDTDALHFDSLKVGIGCSQLASAQGSHDQLPSQGKISRAALRVAKSGRWRLIKRDSCPSRQRGNGCKRRFRGGTSLLPA